MKANATGGLALASWRSRGSVSAAHEYAWGFRFAALFLARLFKVPVRTRFPQSAFTVKLALQTTQRLLDGFTFF